LTSKLLEQTLESNFRAFVQAVYWQPDGNVEHLPEQARIVPITTQDLAYLLMV